MTKFEPPFLTYLASRPPFYDGFGEENARVRFTCLACGEEVRDRVLDCISKGDPWFRSLAASEQRAIADTFGLRLDQVGPASTPYLRFATGRSAYCCTTSCPVCAAGYLVVVDFYEMQPTRYIGILQGASRLVQDNANGRQDKSHG